MPPDTPRAIFILKIVIRSRDRPKLPAVDQLADRTFRSRLSGAGFSLSLFFCSQMDLAGCNLFLGDLARLAGGGIHQKGSSTGDLAGAAGCRDNITVVAVKSVHQFHRYHLCASITAGNETSNDARILLIRSSILHLRHLRASSKCLFSSTEGGSPDRRLRSASTIACNSSADC